MLVWLRLAARLSGSAPAIQPEQAGLQQLSSRLLHLALYVLMIGMPLTGWLVLSAAGKPIPFFGLELPALIGENKGLAKQIKEVHELVGSTGYFLIGLHATAALYHTTSSMTTRCHACFQSGDKRQPLSLKRKQSQKMGA